MHITTNEREREREKRKEKSQRRMADSSTEKEAQLLELVNLTQDPSVVPLDQHETIGKHFSELTQQYPYYSVLRASYIKLKIYQLEQENKGDLMCSSPELEKIIGESIQYCNSYEIWFQYLRYVKLKNSIVVNGREARNTIIEAYNAIWKNCFSKDMETDAGYDFIKDYLKFLNEWQPQDKYEKNDKNQFIRKVYVQCFTTPIKNIEKIWSEYTNWEQALDSIRCRKQISQVSGEYMKSRGLFTEWQTKMSSLILQKTTAAAAAAAATTTLKNSVRDCDVDLKFYLEWIDWEREKQIPEVDSRIDYIYKQALQKMMFKNEKIWYSYSLSQTKFDKKVKILENSLKCLSESVSLTIYLSEIYENHDKNLYLVKIKELFEKLISNYDLEKNEKLVSNIYITYMNTMNRVEGLPGSRKVFNMMRLLKDKLDYRVFFENAKMEYRADSKSLTPRKVLELGLKYHTINNCDYVFDYLKFLMDTNQPLNVIKTVFENYDEHLNTSILDTSHKTLRNKQIYQLMISYGLKMNDGNVNSVLKLQDRYKSKFEFNDMDMFDVFEETRTANLLENNSVVIQERNADENGHSSNDQISNLFENKNPSHVSEPVIANNGFNPVFPQNASSPSSDSNTAPFIELPMELADLLSKMPKSIYFPDQVLKPEMLCKFLRDINIDSITTKD